MPDQLAAAKLSDDQRKQILELLATLQSILERPVTTPQEAEQMARDYLARGGELRDLMDDLLLPDPGDLLPPGPRSRLGILFTPDKRSGQPLVTQVLPQYRADKMGMKVGDTILTLNGQPVTAGDLVQRVVKAQRPYVIDVKRAGRRVTLTEPKR